MFQPSLGRTSKAAGGVKTMFDAVVTAATVMGIRPLWVSPPEEV